MNKDITREEVEKVVQALNRESEESGYSYLFVDQLDDVLHVALLQFANTIGYGIYPKADITNEYLMELRNQIIRELADNFHVKGKEPY